MIDLLKDRIAGGLYGVAVGDALGGPLEFCSAEEITERHGRVSTMLGGGWLHLRPGETTDDTAMTLAVAEGIMENPDDPIHAIGERFIKWAASSPKDIGGTCSAAIRMAGRAIRMYPVASTPSLWYQAARETAKANRGRSGGNGALMRTVYPAIFYPDKEDTFFVTPDGAITAVVNEAIPAAAYCGFAGSLSFVATALGT